MTVAMDRCLKSQRTSGKSVLEVKADKDRMTEHSEWYRKQDELDEKTEGRARDAARKLREVRTKAKAKDEGLSKCKKEVKKAKARGKKGKDQESKSEKWRP